MAKSEICKGGCNGTMCPTYNVCDKRRFESDVALSKKEVEMGAGYAPSKKDEITEPPGVANLSNSSTVKGAYF